MRLYLPRPLLSTGRNEFLCAESYPLYGKTSVCENIMGYLVFKVAEVNFHVQPREVHYVGKHLSMRMSPQSTLISSPGLIPIYLLAASHPLHLTLATVLMPGRSLGCLWVLS